MTVHHQRPRPVPNTGIDLTLSLPPSLRGRLLLLLLLLPGLAGAREDYEQSAAELKALRERIDAIEGQLAERQERRESVVVDLRELEEAIGEANARIRELDRSLAQVRQRLDELDTTIDEQQETAASHRQVLRQALRTAYRQGREPDLKRLLDGRDPALRDRLMVYFEHLGEARRERIRAAVAALEDLRATQAERRTERERLQSLRAERESERAELDRRREQRREVLERVEAAIGDDRERLERLQANEDELETVVEELREALAEVPERDLERPDFTDQRGALPWPVTGDVAARFGDARSGDGEWRGLLVRADRGDAVAAVAHGQVVYADWLRGLGLLVIIDHGDGYMTLYGHNQSLYQDVGDWVQAGDVIARVGDSGGHQRTGLYFELRVDGEPRDPARWLQDSQSE